MKECAKCLISKELSNFNKRSRNKDGYNTICKICIKLVRKKTYEANKKACFERNKRYRNKFKSFITKYKQRPCKDCGVEYKWWIMQFDHLYDKKFNITANVRGKQTVLKEIAKCDVVCANCHADRTYKRRHNLAL